MPIRHVAGTDRMYYLVAYDKQGRERTDDPDGLMSEKVLAALTADQVTDVFIVSHGWHGDVPAAIAQYDRWIASMTTSPDRARMQAKYPSYTPLIVGLHWPSEPWGKEEIAAGPMQFSASDTAAGGQWDSATASPSTDGLIDAYADRIADTDKARQALATIFAAARAPEPVPPPNLSDGVRDAYMTLNAESKLPNGGVDAPPDADRMPFDAVRAYRATRPAAATFGLGSIWDAVLGPLRQISFWAMKNRARRFGESGASTLLAAIQGKAGPDVRVHLVGHSFGCIVVSAMIARPVHTVALLQGALSLWSYSDSIEYANGAPGYFSPIVRDRRVTGPLITSQSRFDRAVGFWYPKAAGVAGQVTFALDIGELPKFGAVGTFGAQGTSTDARVMLPTGGSYGFKPGRIYNLNADQYICHGDLLAGAHNDIAHPEVAHAVWEAILT